MSFSIHPPVIAHRGANHYAPENTLAAFRKAKELGVNWIELDVMLSTDNELVVIHDETLERTTNGKGRICDQSYDYLKTLDAGSWFGLAFSTEKIPSLREVIDLLNDLSLSVNIEIKAQQDREELAVENVLATVQKYWKNTASPPLISSFSLSVLKVVRRHSASSLIGFLMEKWMPDWEKICEPLEPTTIHVNEKILTPERIKKIKSSGYFLLAYTVNEPSRAKELVEWGVDAVFTDQIEAVLGAINDPL